MTDHCAIPRCRGRANLLYLDRGICNACWLDFAEDPDGEAAGNAIAATEPAPAREDELDGTPAGVA